MKWLDLLDAFNLIDRVEGLIMGLFYRDMGRTVRVLHSEEATGNEYEALLKRYHVVVYGRRATSKYLIFQVKTKQAKWAEYLLLRAGAPVVTTFDHRNVKWAGRHAPGKLPPAWQDRGRRERGDR